MIRYASVHRFIFGTFTFGGFRAEIDFGPSLIRKVAVIVGLSLFAPLGLPSTGSGQDNSNTLLKDVPHQIKRPDFGGEACLEMALRAGGHDYTQDMVFNLSGVDPIHGRGAMATEIVAVAKTIGFDTGEPWIQIGTGDRAEKVNEAMARTKASLAKKHPVLFLMRQQAENNVVEQFVLAVGVDEKKETVTLHDPNSRHGKFRVLPKSQFEKAVVLSSNTGPYVFCMPLVEKSIRKPPKASKGFDNADYAQHIRKLRKRLPDDSFHFVIQKPFVVVGNDSPERIQAYASKTVNWCVQLLKKDYFKKDPKYILDVWLFKEKTTYEKYAKQLWGSKPSTPFGYYSSSDRALVMNIGLGSGTLVHEIVHPFIESNFPGCPSWFNEGLASLYEQCGSKDGKIVGYTNWRLRGLQVAIDSERVPSFKQLCGTSRREFYQEDPGTNYAQARYLCYYLQEKGLLRTYYHAFVKNAEEDPTGYKTLQKVLKREDLDAFKADWEKYVMRLRYR